MAGKGSQEEARQDGSACGSSMSRARVGDTPGVKFTLLAVTAGPHTVQSVSRFHTFTRTIAIVKSPQNAGARTGRERKWGGGSRDFFPPPHF